MRKGSICVLISGGLDSDVLLAEMIEQYAQVWPMYIRQGLRWEAVELHWLKKFLKQIARPTLKPLQIFSLPMDDVYGRHWSTGARPVPGARSKDEAVFLPGRNMVLSLKAAIFAASKNVKTLALGSLGHNPFPDATPRFYREWGRVVGRGLGKPIQIVAPYRQLSKAAVIRKGRTEPLELSYSCISPKGKYHCGHCNKCAERQRGFRDAKVEDKTRYA